MSRLGRGFGMAALVAVALLLVLAAATAVRMRRDQAPLAAFDAGNLMPTRHVDIAKVAENLRVVALADADLARRGITRQGLGDLDVSSGSIVAADPLVQPDRPAFARSVPIGRYPVTLYRAKQRLALAELRFAPGTPARWQMALVPNQDAGRLKEGEIFGYPVDAGLGAFMDVDGQAALLAREKDEEARLGNRDSNLYDDVLKGPLDANGGDALLYKPYLERAATIAIFRSGWGDGFYASYWGLDAAGSPLVLVTDFEVLTDGDGRETAAAPKAP